jgi:hypothetical protein
MQKQDKADLIFWSVVAIFALGLTVYALTGCAEATAEESDAAGIPPTKQVDASDELAQQHRSHEVEAVEAGKLDANGAKIDDADAKQRLLQKVADYAQAKRDAAQPAEEPAQEEWVEEYYEPVYVEYSGYSGGSTATTTHDLLNGQGRAYDENGTSYTWYPNDIGNGSIEYRIPGCHYDDSGVAYDEDGYIAVAADGHEYGEVVSTPYGEAKVYDKGSGYGNIDIYTNR